MQSIQSCARVPRALSLFVAILISQLAILANEVTGEQSSSKAAYQPTLEDLKNRTYRVADFKDYGFYELKDGWSCLGNESVHLDAAKLGDLNNDGLTDAAVVISYNGGGTGTITALSILLNDGHRLYQSTDDYSMYHTNNLSMKLENGAISLSYMAQSENAKNLDPCTVKKSERVKLNVNLIAQTKSLFPVPQANLDKCKTIIPALNKLISTNWQSEKEEWNQYSRMSDEEFRDQFSVMHGPRKDTTTKPVWKEPASNAKTIIDFVVNERGCVSQLELTQSSGVQIYDQTTISSIVGGDYSLVLNSAKLVEDGKALNLHVRSVFDKNISCEIPQMTMPVLNNVFPASN